MMRLLMTLILMIPTLGWTTRSFASEMTLPFLQEIIESGERFDDGTCRSTANNNRYRNLCCHSGYRYRCSFLYNQFSNNLCRPNVNSRGWQRCNGLPEVSEEEAAQEPSRPAGTYSLTRPTGALSYATDLTACASYGVRNAGGANFCARGVRHALACMARRQGMNVNNMYFHCGGSAFNYYGSNCLERLGFVDTKNSDPASCNRPGVVRVYYGGHHRQRGYSGGDYHGHIEFLGTDGLWHAGVSSALPIDQRLGRNNRILKACYVLPEGRAR